MFKKIAVAVDGSDFSKKALNAAIVLGKEQKAALSVIHVVHSVQTRYTAGEVALSVAEFNRAIRQEGEELLSRSKTNAEDAGIHCTTQLLTGDVAQSIVQYAAENGVNLIVVGSHGRGMAKEILLGSVSHKVAQLAKCPVLIVK
ncbi:universal stress protein [Aneurinibacillus terranovensis]|uniref:universal stress protein n=1 Tax=Aneurinibacillus terranovensis TaxID=278991 RepID=UPI0004131248|nr:universal stress protein [Aneurinibacillus terranovensis]